MESLPHLSPWRIQRAMRHDARPPQGSLPAVFADEAVMPDTAPP